MKSLVLISAVICVAFAGPAFSQGTTTSASNTPPATATATVTATAAAPGEKLICRSERVTGTRNSKRVCRTVEQIQSDKEAAQEFTRMGQRKTSAESGGG